ncbi:DUF2169 domain-containing protein [Caballeronia sp. M1242]|uniref:DUF2169 family type VI secretion system accessory protein n=1 Tax=Caballeronia sp. M1242 TaxID=2814653 RepID=UPI0019D295B6|nr:DUF2169 domain-containing protein [Caballeronia sp. M1242]QSN64238.1 DUF2169 domain-containing protein [Caballeronia sp. M1242]
MRFTNETGLPASWTLGFERSGRERLIVIVKATYVLPTAGEQAVLADIQLPLIKADCFSGAPGLTAPTYETDYAHCKPACDVLLLGSAYAPRGRPVKRLAVGMQVGGMVKQFTVVGPRCWQKRFGVASPSEPQYFDRLPISYDTAYGGVDSTEAAQGRAHTYERNPVGKGYWRNSRDLEGQPLPFTEQSGRAITDPSGDYLPMAFSPVGRNWLPRRLYAGTYDEQWMQTTAPLWPADFDERYFQAAPPDQIMPFPSSDLTMRLLNLTPDGDRRFRLPVRRIPVTFVPYQGRDAQRDASLDTILLEPDEGRFTLTWRVVLPLGKSVFDVKETVVGEMPRAWHMARRFPGKTWYRNLDEAVRARKGRPRTS